MVAVTYDGSSIGTANASGQLTYTFVGAIPAGATIVVGVLQGNATSMVVNNDSKGNVYTQRQGNSFGAFFISMFSARVATAIAGGDTFVVDGNASSTATAIQVLWVDQGPASPFDLTSVGAANSAGPMSSGATAALTDLNEVAVGFAARTAAVTITEDSNFTNDALFNWGASSRGVFGHRIVSDGAAQTYAPTYSGASGNWQSAICTFKTDNPAFVPYQPVYQSGPILAQ